MKEVSIWLVEEAAELLQVVFKETFGLFYK